MAFSIKLEDVNEVENTNYSRRINERSKNVLPYYKKRVLNLT